MREGVATLGGMMDTIAAAGAQQVKVDGASIEFVAKGSGQTLLYLHPGDGFDPDAVFFQRLARSFRVIAPSHPGFGGSALPPGINSVDDLAYFYLDFLEELE